MASKGRGFRVFSIEGFEVLVGKGDAHNDALTFGEALPRDFWMHVAGCPGSHVVVRNPEGLDELPRAVLEGAAALAAFHSKARGARGKVEVHVCRVADVSKPRGFARGEVRLRRYDSVRVYPREPETADIGPPLLPPDGEAPRRDR
jgi:predicted ribosome quality control (RQC) complex YloA/Tae2 family protein